MHLSRFFTLDELTHSNTAKAEGINNQPTATEVECLRALCGAVLDPLREAMGNAIKVNSGYRGPALNRRLKGALKSQHLDGQAADIQSPGVAVLDLFKTAIRLGLPFDQIIYEVKGTSKWVHVSHRAGANDGEILLAKFAADGRVSYPRITAEQALAMTEPVTRSGAFVEPTYVETADEPEREVPRDRPTEAAEPAPEPARKAKAPVRKKAPAKKAAKPKKPARRKPAAKKVPKKKVAAKKVATRKSPAKKAAAKRRAGTRKPSASKVTARKATAKKAATKKAATGKAPAKKAVKPKRAAPRKPAAKKATAKKTAARKAPAKKVTTRKAPKPAGAKKSSTVAG